MYKRQVLTDHGEIENDALIIATGGRFLKGMPGIEHALTLCEGVAAAERIRDRLNEMDGGHVAFGFGGNPKEPSAMRGGPMFELLFGVETWLRQQGKRDKFKLIFFNAAAEPGKRLGEKAVKNLLIEMQRRGVATHLGEKILGFDERSLKTENATLPADLILFMPGLTGPAWAAQSGIELSSGGFFPADEYCAVKGCDKVFVAGDAGSYPGPDWLPKQAHMADQMCIRDRFGEIDAASLSLPVLTILVAGLDAFNPCAFFVLLFLLSLLVHQHDRRRMFIIGGVFVAFSGLMYFAFMAAWLNLFLVCLLYTSRCV